MKIKEYLKRKKIGQNEFAAKIKISRFSLHKYIHGSRPAKRQAWRIFNATDGEISFPDMGYSSPPKRPARDD
jgi:predicted transcriptional regulator